MKDTYARARSGADLARFVDTRSDKLFFTVITVTDELNAFKVFETLNARGVRLSPTDLSKNYLFSVVYRDGSHEHQIEALDGAGRQWWASWEARFPNFLRVRWNSRRRFVREADLFKTIRAHTSNKGEVFDPLRAIKEDLGPYVALSSRKTSSGHRSRATVSASCAFLPRVNPGRGSSRRTGASKRRGFAGILRACAVVSLRYNVIGGLARPTATSDAAQAMLASLTRTTRAGRANMDAISERIPWAAWAFSRGCFELTASPSGRQRL